MVINSRWPALALCLVMAGGLGCSNTQRADDEPVRERPRRGADMTLPSPDELGDHPCGNPNWATLPPEVGQLARDESDDDPDETGGSDDRD